MTVHAVRDQNHGDMVVLYGGLCSIQTVLGAAHKLYVRTKVFSM